MRSGHQDLTGLTSASSYGAPTPVPWPRRSRSRTDSSSGYVWSVPVNPAGLAKHYFEPALAALGFDHERTHDLRHACAVMRLTAGEHYMAMSKMRGYASYLTTLTTSPRATVASRTMRRPVPSSVTNLAPMRRPGQYSRAPKAAEWV
jgi:integrase